MIHDLKGSPKVKSIHLLGSGLISQDFQDKKSEQPDY